MEEEFLLNENCSLLALKFRTLRLQRGLTIETLSIISKIDICDIIAFETDKKTPTEEQKSILMDCLTK